MSRPGEPSPEAAPDRTTARDHTTQLARLAPLALFLVVLLVFSAWSPAFRTTANLRNILVQSSSVAIVGVGMTFVLLTGGIDLSVGAIMFVTAAVVGRLAIGWSPDSPRLPVTSAVPIILLLGALLGSVNASLVALARLKPFIVTLATLFIGRGLALHITQTRPLNLPPQFLAISQTCWLGIPLPIVLMAAAVVIGQIVLSCTPFGRHLYALGENPEAARRAGLRPTRLLFAVYVISGLCAALGGLVSVAQLGTVSPTFGFQREFGAIAAVVLGGTSLFGGRGSIIPGTLLGALLIQTVESGLNITNADPYSYPVVVGATIYLGGLIERLRNRS